MIEEGAMPRTHYAKQKVTTGWEHRYRCGCTVPNGQHWHKGWVVEISQSPTPGFNNVQHHSLAGDASACTRYLRSVGAATAIVREQDVVIPYAEPAWAHAELLELHKSHDVPTCAMMWCGQTQQWYFGACRHMQAMTNPPVANAVRLVINGKCTERQVDANGFGLNCAEIACVIKAYTNGRTLPHLQGCVFVAHSKACGFVSACKTCSSWISALGGKYRSYMQGKFVELK